MDLRHLQNLVYLADELHFGRAAKRAHLSQSAFTRSIQALEDEIGLTLFDRNKRVVRITAVGKTTAERARALLAGQRDLEHELELIRTGGMGSVAIGGGPFSSGFLVLPALARLQRAHPGVSARLEIYDAGMGLEHLKAERIDLLVGDLRYLGSSKEYSTKALGEFSGHLYCRSTHPLAGKRKVKPADLRPYSLASAKLPPTFVERMHAALGLAPGEGLDVGFECSCVATLVEMARNTDMILLATDCAVRHAVERGEMKRMEIEGFDRTTGLLSAFGLARLAGRTLSPAAEMLYEMLIEGARETRVAPA